MKTKTLIGLIGLFLITVCGIYLMYLKNKYKTIISSAKDSKEAGRLIKGISRWDSNAITAIEIGLVVLTLLLGFSQFV